MTQLSKINFNKLYEDVEKVIPVSEQYINGVWLVGSFADPETTVTANSDIDIFLDVTDDAESISCVQGRYGTVSIESEKNIILYKNVPIQLLTSRQPNVSINSFENTVRLD